MRTLKKNKQKLKYSLQLGEIPVYETDEFGNIVYVEVDGKRIPVETGEKELAYSIPVDFKANIAMSGGRAESEEFGIDLSAYDAVIICNKNELPVTETSLIWFKNEVGYKDLEKKIVDEKTADYSVVKVSESLNQTKYVLKRKS